MTRLTRRTILAAAPGALAAAALPARAAKQYGPGVTDTEIKIGNTGPYSGPLANASPIPLSMKAYFAMINAQGGNPMQNRLASPPRDIMLRSSRSRRARSGTTSR